MLFYIFTSWCVYLYDLLIWLINTLMYLKLDNISANPIPVYKMAK